MKKKQLLASLAISTIVLSQAGAVFAAENVAPVDNSSSPLVTVPAPSAEPGTSVTQPTETPSSTDQTSPVDGTTTPGAQLPSEPSQPSTPPSTVTPSDPNIPPTSTEEPTKPGGNTTSSSSETLPADGKGQTAEDPKSKDPATPPNQDAPTISAQTAASVGANQVGTTSQVTGQVVSNVSLAEPIFTNTGYQIVSTQNSQVVIAAADGSTQTVAPEVVGATVNSDKTISVTDQAGKMTTLPSTGDKGSLLTVLGSLLLGVGTFFLKKLREAKEA
jgi:hypothetical protein